MLKTFMLARPASYTPPTTDRAVRTAGSPPPATTKRVRGCAFLIATLAMPLFALPAGARGLLTLNAATPVGSAITATIVSAQQAQAATARSESDLARVARALTAMQTMQSAARNLALSAPTSVPNGLARGGLVPDSGLAAAGIAKPVITWVGADTPVQKTIAGQTDVTVTQTAQKAIATWSSFNVGRNTTLTFDQSAGATGGGGNNWVVLNRVIDPSGVPSQILGSIRAAGSVYLLNDNGIIFGGSSQVNVGSLLVSSLDLFNSYLPTSNADFLAHGIADQGFSQLQLLTSPDGGRGAVKVDAGAAITARDLGLVLIAAPNVTNSGEITAPDGQVGLIAGIGVARLFDDGNGGSLTGSPNINALSFFNYSQLSNSAASPGTLVNNGLVDVPRGDAALLGGVIDQNGIVLTSTSVSRPGTIEIEATYDDNALSNPQAIAIQQSGLSGPVDFGAGAVTAIVPDGNGATVPTASAASVRLGVMTITGDTVNFLSGSLTEAPGQTIDVAASPFNLLNAPNYPADAPTGSERILVESGAIIDVAGIADVQLPAANAALTERLAGNELADSPLQRDGFLYGKTVTVNDAITGTRSDGLAWVGTPLADLSGYAGLVPQTIDQVLINGGAVSLRGGEFAFASGAVINLMGGYVHNLAGTIDTTRLVDSSGHLVNIADADPEDTYVSVAGSFTVDHARWGVTDTFASPIVANTGTEEPDGITGGNAGTLSVDVSDTSLDDNAIEEYAPGAGAIVLDGRIDARAFAGETQVNDGTLPRNGALSITSAFPIEIGSAASLSASAAVAASLPAGYGPESPLLATYPPNLVPKPIQPGSEPVPKTKPYANPYINANVLLSGTLDDADFASVFIESEHGAVTVNPGTTVAVQNGGAITLNGIYAAVYGDLTARAGTISVNTSYAFGGEPVPYLAQQAAPDDSIVVGAGAALNVSGLFVNDTSATTATLQGANDLNGGTIALTVDAGELTTKTGKLEDKTGDIVLAAGSVLNLAGGGRILPDGRLQMNGDLPAGSGGNLTLAISGGDALEATFPKQRRLELDGTIDALGFAGGGTLTLHALGLQIGGDSDPALRPAYAFYFDPQFWGDAGFASFDLSADYDAVIPGGADINLTHENLIPDDATIVLAPTGADPAAFAAPGLLAAGLRTPTDLSVSAGLQHTWFDSMNDVADYQQPASYKSGGGVGTSRLSLDQVVLAPGARIVADPAATVALSSIGQVSIYGAITAPGGAISLTGGGFQTVTGETIFGALYLGPNSVLNAAGMLMPAPDAQPVLTAAGSVTPVTGTLLPGGSVTLADDWGPVFVAAGALINVAGASATLDVAQQAPLSDALEQTVETPRADWSNGGAVTIDATTGLVFEGTLAGASGAPAGMGGTLTISQDAAGPIQNFVADASIVLVQDTAAALTLGGYYVPKDYQPGTRVASVTRSQAALLFGVDSLAGSGFANLVLTSTPASGQTTVAFSGHVSLALPGSLVVSKLATYVDYLPVNSLLALPAGDFNPNIPRAGEHGSLSVTAAYIDLSGVAATIGPLNSVPPPPAFGEGTLNLAAKAIDLTGAVSFGGVAQATLTSATAIRLLPLQSNNDFTGTTPNPAGQYVTGALATAGNLTLDAAQIYPATDTIFVLEAAGPKRTTITFGYPAGVAPATAPPLSANGVLVVDATTIDQGGNLVAPFGQIYLGIADATPGGKPTAGTVEAMLGLDAGSLSLPAPVVTGADNLLAGGITSVTGGGAVIPYGSTIDGTSWVYDPLIDTVAAADANSSFAAPLTAPPAKYIGITATAIAIDAGAIVNLSGGGDLQASEWVAGTGGSRDVLTATNISYASGNATAATVPLYPDDRPVYAILPGYQGNTAPDDPYFDEGLSAAASGQGSAAGQAVYLSGVPGLAPGVYTLLPGQYATLPGAYRVVQVTGVSNPQASQSLTLPDGTVQTAGYLVSELTGARGASTAEFQVQSAAVWGQYSQYALTSANNFFSAYAAQAGSVTPALPMDAGHLVLGETSTTKLALDGTTLTAPAGADGAGAEIDIVAKNIQIVGDGAAAAAGYLQIDATALDDLDAGSLLIGGVRTSSAKGETITPEANEVLVTNDSAAPLRAPEVLLVATPAFGTASVTLDDEGDDVTGLPVPKQRSGKVTVAPGSVIEAAGAIGRAVPEAFGVSLAKLPGLPRTVYVSEVESEDAAILTQYYTLLAGDLGSVLQVSNGAPVKLNVPSPPQLRPAAITVIDNVKTANRDFAIGLPALTSGSGVIIDSGARVLGGQTLTLAGGGATSVAGGAVLGGANLYVSGSRISFAGNATASAANTAVINPAALARLQNVKTAVFASTGTIDFAGDVTLRLASGALTLSAGTLTDSLGGAATITAPSVTLDNELDAASATGPKAMPATLAIDAGTVTFGAGAQRAIDFTALTVHATSAVIGAGSGSFNAGAAAVTLNTPALIAASDSTQTLTTTGAIAVTAAPGLALADAADVGGAITLTGASVTVAAPVEALAGNVTLDATTGDVSLATGGDISVAAVARQFYDVTEYADAGTVTLTAAEGSVTEQTGTAIDFGAAAAGGGDAGSLTISATAGDITLAGGIAGGASAGFKGGSVTLASDGAQDFPVLAAQLAAAGITGGVAVTAGHGDLVLNRVLTSASVTLTASSGAVVIDAGAAIDADGAAGGTIDLYGATAVTVDGSLLAAGSSPGQTGGVVQIGTTGTWNGTLNSVYGYENVTSSGVITVGPAAVIDVSGGMLGGNAGGSISFRAPLLTDGDVNLSISRTARLVDDVIGGGTATGGIDLDAYAVWSTADGGKFDGIIDPAGWYDSAGNLLPGAFTTPNGRSFAYTPGSLSAAKLATDLADDYFVPTTYNTAHAEFYGGYDPNTQSFAPLAPDAGNLPAFIQNPGFAFGGRFSGIAGFEARPEIDLVNPEKTIDGGDIQVLTNWNLAAGTCADAACATQTLTDRYDGTIAPVIRIAAAGDVRLTASITDGFFQAQGVQLPKAPNEQALQNNYQLALEIEENDTNSVTGGASLVFNNNSSAPIGSVDPNFMEAAPLPGGSTFYYENVEGYGSVAGYIGTYDGWSQTNNFLNDAYEPISIIAAPAPRPAGFATYADYLVAYQSYVTANFPSLTSGTPPAPLAPASLADYQAYLTEYNNFYADYNFNAAILNAAQTAYIAIDYIYAPSPPAFKAAAPPVVLPAPPNLPSDMATRGNPLPVQFATLISGQSSSYEIVAGAAAGNPDPLATGGTGNVTLDGATLYDDKISGLDVAAPTTLRTGTGSIDISAGGDVSLADATAPGVIYTAGTPEAGTAEDTAGAWTSAGSYSAANPFGTGLTNVMTGPVNPQGAGSIAITAGGDVIGGEQVYDQTGKLTGAEGSYDGQTWSNWLTADANDPNIGWYVNFGAFDQGVLSLGGNVSVTAGGNVSDLAVSLPTTSYITTTDGVAGTVSSLAGRYLVYTGGGVLTVRAGGNILSGAYYIGQGSATLRAGAAVASDFDYTVLNGFAFPPAAGGSALSTLLAVQNGTIAVQARTDADIAGIDDPTDLGGAGGLDITSMTAASAVAVAATAGTVSLNDFDYQGSLIQGLIKQVALANSGMPSDLLPASLCITAFDGGIAIDGGGGLFPAATGELSLIADQTITLIAAEDQIGNVLQLLDDPLNTGVLPSALDPVAVNAQLLTPNDIHGGTPLHAPDNVPVRLYSLAGGLSDGMANTDGTAADNIAIEPDKPADIRVAGTISNLAFYGENVNAADITTIAAGGDIADLPISPDDSSFDTAGTPPLLELAGPGNFLITAGGSITFASQRVQLNSDPQPSFSQSDIETGIRTIGNAVDRGPAYFQSITAADTDTSFGDPYLPSGGAAVTVLFGVGPGVDDAGFINDYVNPANAETIMPSDLAALVDAVGGYEARLGNAADAAPSAATAWRLFQALPAPVQDLLADQVFFAILDNVGTDYNLASSPYYHQYARGYQAIDTLFPAAYGYTANALNGGTNGANRTVATGNLDLRGSTIQTQQGGGISLLGPGGSILVGTQTPPPAYVQPYSEGIITVENGGIDTFTDGDVDVAQSRVMTEQGGNIVMWSSNGNLDAGKGAKTSLSFPLPVYACDNDDACTQNALGLVTGAGIATLQTIPGAPLGNANLIAPRGTVDAGAAGIRVSGNLNVAALHVANAFNIQVQGSTTGVPAAVLPNITALTSAGNAAGAAVSAAEAAARQKTPDQLPSIWIVEILGYGGDGTEPRKDWHKRTS